MIYGLFFFIVTVKILFKTSKLQKMKSDKQSSQFVIPVW